MERNVADIPQMYAEMMILMKMQGKEEPSRNGNVLTLQEPLTVTVYHPTRRTLYDPIRNANPFFHVMEFVWMMAGSNTPDWIANFNSRFVEYADGNNETGVDIIHGAYGHRWIYQFRHNQLLSAVHMLRKNPSSRRVVLQMWSAELDLDANHADLPCNTHIYLRIVNDALEMTVCNRSNDVIWGMTGANAVHMTFLQELMALDLGVKVGVYRVFTNNAHVYADLPNVDKMLDTMTPHYAESSPWEGIPLLEKGETMAVFLKECKEFVDGYVGCTNNWLRTVALPVRNIYLSRREYGITDDLLDKCDLIEDKNWRVACIQWLQRKCQ